MLIVVLVAVAATLIGVIAARQWLGPPAEYLAASIYPEARPLSEFRLTDADGQAFTEQRLRDRITLLFFGFTNCPDICPTTLYDLSLVKREMVALGISESDIQFVFISVDPARDK
ncbi:MAG: SCO family protein, partial [Wenzhouxiangellaceae bacterium]